MLVSRDLGLKRNKSCWSEIASWAGWYSCQFLAPNR